MSYCRWSSLNWRCDLYCYEDTSGMYVIHVAANTREGKWPEYPPFALMAGKIKEEEYAEKRREFDIAFDKSTLVPITLPFAGETFEEPTLQTFRARLLELRALGYRFPDHMLTTIEEEIRDEEENAVNPTG